MTRITAQGGKRFGVFHWAAVAVTLLLLAGSSMSSAAVPVYEEGDAEGGPAAQSTRRGSTLSPQDRTATARANVAAGRDRNKRFIPTAIAIVQDAEVIFGPESGELESEADQYLELYCAGVDVANFVITVRVFNPTGGTGNWDHGMLFRADEDNNAYRFTITNQNQWLLAYFNAAASRFNNAGIGSIPNMDRDRSGFNDLIVMVQDELALISVNGEYLTPVRVYQQIGPGEICLAIDNFSERNGRVFAFENFTIYELP